MDLLRGISIFLVVLNHSILFARDGIGSPEAAVILNDILAPIRMPMLVFLSGLMVAPSLAKGRQRFMSGKVERIAYPYVAWSVIVLVQGFATDARDEVSFNLSNILRIFIDPLAHLWFLYYLLAYYLIALFTRRISPWWVIFPSLVACGVIPDENFRRFFILMAFFMVGAWVSRRPTRLERAVSARWMLLAAAVISVANVLTALAGANLRYTLASASVAAAGIILAIALARRIASARSLTAVRFIGRDSLIFYLVHWYPTSVAVQVSSRFDSQWLTLGAGLIAGVGAGFAVCWLISLWPPVNWLFVMPTKGVARGSSKRRDSF
ncbi:hypothetical protein B1729_09915 [Microbacterium sp. B35-04]|uniref:acyltransferase family protein n=1 Tax=Microbacterium sp. B35-04 TaxID=1961716 RepID=UPI0013D60D79|nr:acyltransferase [Microbacterium sp. B35-04]KAF2413426.1 hypothetical protein B1729_09915 [Microbacterium sp. B35-04]